MTPALRLPCPPPLPPQQMGEASTCGTQIPTRPLVPPSQQGRQRNAAPLRLRCCRFAAPVCSVCCTVHRTVPACTVLRCCTRAERPQTNMQARPTAASLPLQPSLLLLLLNLSSSFPPALLPALPPCCRRRRRCGRLRRLCRLLLPAL